MKKLIFSLATIVAFSISGVNAQNLDVVNNTECEQYFHLMVQPTSQGYCAGTPEVLTSTIESVLATSSKEFLAPSGKYVIGLKMIDDDGVTPFSPAVEVNCTTMMESDEALFTRDCDVLDEGLKAVYSAIGSATTNMEVTIDVE